MIFFPLFFELSFNSFEMPFLFIIFIPFPLFDLTILDGAKAGELIVGAATDGEVTTDGAVTFALSVGELGADTGTLTGGRALDGVATATGFDTGARNGVEIGNATGNATGTLAGVTNLVIVGTAAGDTLRLDKLMVGVAVGFLIGESTGDLATGKLIGVSCGAAMGVAFGASIGAFTGDSVDEARTGAKGLVVGETFGLDVVFALGELFGVDTGACVGVVTGATTGVPTGVILGAGTGVLTGEDVVQLSGGISDRSQIPALMKS